MAKGLKGCGGREAGYSAAAASYHAGVGCPIIDQRACLVLSSRRPAAKRDQIAHRRTAAADQPFLLVERRRCQSGRAEVQPFPTLCVGYFRAAGGFYPLGQQHNFIFIIGQAMAASSPSRAA